MDQSALHAACAEIVDQPFPILPFLRDIVEHGKQHDAFDADVGPAGAPDNVLELGDVDPFAGAMQRVHDRGGRGQVQPLRQRRRGDGDLEDILAQQPLDLLAVGGRQRAVVQRHPDAEALEDGAIRSEPFLTERDRGLQDRGVGLEQRAKRAAFVQFDDDVGERLHALA